MPLVTFTCRAMSPSQNGPPAPELCLCLFAGHTAAMIGGWILFLPDHQILRSVLAFLLCVVALYLVDHWTWREAMGSKPPSVSVGLNEQLMVFCAGVFSMVGAIGCFVVGRTNPGIAVLFFSAVLPRIFSSLRSP